MVGVLWAPFPTLVHHPSPPAHPVSFLTSVTPRTCFGLVKNPQPCMGKEMELFPHCFPSLSASHSTGLTVFLLGQGQGMHGPLASPHQGPRALSLPTMAS